MTDDDGRYAICPADEEEYDREWDLNHEEHDSEHPNHYKFCDIEAPHYHEDTEVIYD